MGVEALDASRKALTVILQKASVSVVNDRGDGHHILSLRAPRTAVDVLSLARLGGIAQLRQG